MLFKVINRKCIHCQRFYRQYIDLHPPLSGPTHG